MKLSASALRMTRTELYGGNLLATPSKHFRTDTPTTNEENSQEEESVAIVLFKDVHENLLNVS